MNRNELKQRSIKRLINSFIYSIEGLKYAFKYEQNMTIHIISVILIILVSIFLKLTQIEWLIIIILMGLVVATELINTSLEAVVDLVSPEINPLAKIAKDTAAASVLVFALTAIIVGLMIYVPKILMFL